MLCEGNFKRKRDLTIRKREALEPWQNGCAKPDRQAVKKVVTEVELRALEDILARVASQTTKEEQEYIAEENIQNQVQKDCIDLQRKFSLMEAIVKETKALQDLTRYPYKHYNTSELEQHYASLAEQWPKRCVCPLCYADNVEVLGGVLQSNEEAIALCSIEGLPSGKVFSTVFCI
ncbi:hypothetical protein OIU77_019380 [Salix suchowensis]|uniref:Uncharacterized protein n=1 Tax=Salix suchowensis TaxID=1278906 RepID=A0ABQ9CFX7_9ROSI|nr:hypothetical protein OIU77_019380 [Salix suchowensis]